MVHNKVHINCKDCGINQLCLPAMLAEAEVNHLDSIVQRATPPIDKGSHIYTEGDSFDAVYAVKSGAFKSYVTNYSGEQQIVAFHLPGEIIGLDAINTEQHISSAMALEESTVCKIPYVNLEELVAQLPGLRHQMMRLMSKKISDDQELLLLLGQKPANEKMAALLTNLSARYEARKLPKLDFNLPMSRSEIACYLGLTIETVSRILKTFKEKNYIDIKGKSLHILNQNSLKRLAGIACA